MDPRRLITGALLKPQRYESLFDGIIILSIGDRSQDGADHGAGKIQSCYGGHRQAKRKNITKDGCLMIFA